jgi:heat shock protein HslJ
MGVAIADMEPKLPKDAYITLKAEENRIIGNLGCNGFSGTYELGPDNRIRFSQIVSTRMMCLNMTVEDELKQVLGTADSYYVQNDTLILNRARMAPLARFTAVYMN